jgi:phage repressor protein C with HTH and peptisase S24 domain
MDEMTVYRKRRLKNLIETRFKGSQKDLAAAANLSEGRITQMLDPEDSFGERAARTLAGKLGLDERYFETGFPADPDYMQVSRVDVAVGAGDGKPVYTEDIIGGLAFRRDFLRECGIYSSDDAVVLTVRGDSMAGSVWDGAVILVNTKRRDPVRNKVFVFVNGEGPVVKRVAFNGGQWIAQSDNPDKDRYPDFPFKDGNTLIGQAVWMGAKL